MFKNLAAEMLGTSDIGVIIEPKDFNRTDIDDYIFHEDNEKIFFVIKSKMDEYCFTNVAFMHLDGTSAMSKKRMLHRYLYKHHPIKNVLLETAGSIDLDAEIKFQLGEQHFSIDIDKKQKQIQLLDAELADPALYEKNPAKAAEKAKLRAATVDKLGEAEDQWLELSAEYEEAMAG